MPLLIVRKQGRELRRFSFNGDIVIIGRDNYDTYGNPDLPLPDTSRRVSRFHAALIRDRRDFYFLRDLSSANGTFVNNQLVYGRRLYENDRIGVGDFELQYTDNEKAPTDLSQAIRVVTSIPSGPVRSEMTALGDAPEEAPEQISHSNRLILHDILQRIKSLNDDSLVLGELLGCVVPASGAQRGMIASVELPFRIVPEAIYGIDVGCGEQMSVSGEYVHKVLERGSAPVEIFAGTEVLCVPLPIEPDKRRIIYLQCDHAQSFTDESKVFMELLCSRLQEVVGNRPEHNVEDDNKSRERFEWKARMVAKSREMREVIADINLCADMASNILLHGETGSGKEVTARAIHERSARNTGPFVPVELSNLDREMVSSTLFGWLKGSFTGADKDGRGAFEKANGGTIYLDEIGDINLDVQVKLRRAVEEKEVSPLGSASSIYVDVKVIAATNVDLDEAIKEKRFRDDLVQRFGKRIDLPPLRERKSDIPLLACFFIDQTEGPLQVISHGAMRMLVNYDWPGNVRELREMIKELAARGKEIIFSFDLPERFHPTGQASRETGLKTIQESEKLEIIKVLRRVNWNKSKAWKILGYGSKQTLYNKIKKYNITPPSQLSTDES